MYYRVVLEVNDTSESTYLLEADWLPDPPTYASIKLYVLNICMSNSYFSVLNYYVSDWNPSHSALSPRAFCVRKICSLTFPQVS